MVADEKEGKLDIQRFQVRSDDRFDMPTNAIETAITSRPLDTGLRVVLVVYYWDPKSRTFSGLNRFVLDHIAQQYRVHTELLSQHFAWTEGLWRYGPGDEGRPAAVSWHPLSTSPVLCMTFDSGFLTAQLCLDHGLNGRRTYE